MGIDGIIAKGDKIRVRFSLRDDLSTEINEAELKDFELYFIFNGNKFKII